MLTDETCLLQATSDLFTLLHHEDDPLFDLLMTKFSGNCGVSNPSLTQQLEWLDVVVQMQRNHTSEYLMAKLLRNCGASNPSRVPQLTCICIWIWVGEPD